MKKVFTTVLICIMLCISNNANNACAFSSVATNKGNDKETTLFLDNKKFNYKNIRKCKGKTFKNQLTDENTTYVIRNHFDLNGEEVTIPNNSSLKFEGGSLRNGTVVFSDTEILGKKKKNIFKSIKVRGRIKGDCYAQWFDEKDVLEQLFVIADRRIILNEGDTYGLSNNLVFPRHDLELYGNGATILFRRDGIKISLNSLDNILIENIVIDGQCRTNLGISCYRCNHIGLKTVTVRNIAWDDSVEKIYCYGIEMIGCNDIHVDGCVIEDVKATREGNVAGGIAFKNDPQGGICKGLFIENSIIRRIWSFNNGIGVGADCLVFMGRYREDKETNAIIENCSFSDFTKRAIKAQACKIEIVHCTFYFTSFMSDKKSPNNVIEIFGSDSKIINNIINVSGHQCKSGIRIYSPGRAFINKNELMFDEKEMTQNVVISGNEIVSDDMSYGILIGIADESDANIYRDIVILDNVIRGGKSLYYGIRTLDCLADSRIESNTIENANIGIWLNSPQKSLTIGEGSVTYYAQHSGLTIKNNELIGNMQQCGVKFDCVNKSSVIDNKIKGFKSGLILGTSNTGTGIKKCIIQGNEISGCEKGIEASDGCADISISNNEFTGNTYYDMVLGSEKKNFDLKGNITTKLVIYNVKKKK